MPWKESSAMDERLRFVARAGHICVWRALGEAALGSTERVLDTRSVIPTDAPFT